ncbi:MAG TPA: hypothetical protein VGQ57_11400 [Polyangiaceae bacterium]|jgi:hypothetical protein|nr:hypothetical protein [Polyangiaceae bacterium]
MIAELSTRVAPSGGAPISDHDDAHGSTPCAGGYSDPVMALLALMIQSRGVQSEVARADVEQQSRLVEEMRDHIQAAMKRAEEAQDHAGFWGELQSVLGGDVAALCGVVAALALTAASGGLGAPAILALAAAGMSATADLGDRLKLDPRICAGLSIGGALVGILGGGVSDAAGFWSTLSKGANVTQAVAAGGGSGAGVAEGQFQATALEARADSKQFEAQRVDAWQRLELAIEILKGAARDLTRGEGTAADTLTSKSAGRTAILARMGAA